jgi:hypothetical protein
VTIKEIQGQGSGRGPAGRKVFIYLWAWDRYMGSSEGWIEMNQDRANKDPETPGTAIYHDGARWHTIDECHPASAGKSYVERFVAAFVIQTAGHGVRGPETVNTHDKGKK